MGLSGGLAANGGGQTGGGGSSNYQTLDVGGSAQTQRAALNLIGSPSVTITPADNSGANRTDVTFTAPGSPNPQPSDQGLVAWNLDTAIAVGNSAPPAGVLTLVQIPVRASTTFATAWVVLTTLGTGTAAANSFVGLYVVSGANLQLIGSTADQSTSWTTGTASTARSGALTVQGGQSLTQNATVYGGVLIGTQSGTTTIKLANGSGGPGTVNAGPLVVGSTVLRVAQFGSALSALPATVAIASLTQTGATNFWVGVS